MVSPQLSPDKFWTESHKNSHVSTLISSIQYKSHEITTSQCLSGSAGAGTGATYSWGLWGLWRRLRHRRRGCGGRSRRSGHRSWHGVGAAVWSAWCSIDPWSVCKVIYAESICKGYVSCIQCVNQFSYESCIDTSRVNQWSYKYNNMYIYMYLNTLKRSFTWHRETKML